MRRSVTQCVPDRFLPESGAPQPRWLPPGLRNPTLQSSADERPEVLFVLHHEHGSAVGFNGRRRVVVVRRQRGHRSRNPGGKECRMLADTYMASRPFSGGSRKAFLISAIGVVYCKENIQIFVTSTAAVIK